MTRDALVVKLLGKNVGYFAMKDRLQRVRKAQGGFEILDADNGYYMVKFDLQSDKERVESGGAWMIFDHYLYVFNWAPNFASPSAKIQRTMVWGLASVIGKPIRVDKDTLNVERGRFARVCLEIDLTQSVVGKFWIKDNWYHVEYEGLHLICAKCGCYGHLVVEFRTLWF